MMNPRDVSKKIEEYEHFVEYKLKNDLREIEKSLKIKAEKTQDWKDVKQVVKAMKEFDDKNRDMNVRFDIGNGLMASGEITDFKRNYVCIGLGYMLEMDCDEADKYSNIRLKLLQKEIEHLRKLAVNIKVHIKMVLLALDELRATLYPDKAKDKK